MAIDHQAILAAIDFAKENAYGSDEASNLGQKRAKAIEYYLGLNTNPAPEGRSQVVDRSVYETVQVILPSLVKIFSGSSDEICKCVPIGPDDEPGAEQTTAVLRHYVTEKNQWEQVCNDWIHDALLLSNGYAMAYWDESKRLIRENYEGQSDDQVAALMQDSNVNVLQHSQAVDEQATSEAQAAFEQQLQQYRQAVGMAEMQASQAGQPFQAPPPPQPPQPVLRHDLVIERQENEGKLCIRVLPPEHCEVSSFTPDWTLNECPYFKYTEQKTIADLRLMGLEVSEDISDDPNESVEDQARDRFGENRDEENKGVMRLVWADMVWVKADAEGDNESRLYYVIKVGRTILHAEPVGRIPVSSMTAQPLPHRHIGMSLAETTWDIQDIKQAIKRGALDNLYLANNGRHVISQKVSLEDFLDSRPGGVVRMLDDTPPGPDQVFPLVHPFAFDNIVGSLEYFDQDRQNRTGANRYFAGTDAGALNKTAQGTAMLQNMASMRVEHIARMMAPAVESLFTSAWEIISKHANKALAIKLKGSWALVDPQAWRTKRDIRISVGVGAGNKESMMAQLSNMLSAQVQIGIPLGLCGRDEIHATNVELAKLAGFANPLRFWPDPSGKPAPPQPPSPEQIKAQSAMQIKQMELQNNAQKFQMEQQAKFAELEKQHALKIEEIRANLSLQAQNDERDAVKDIQKSALDAEKARLAEENKRAIAEMDAALEKYKADLQAQVTLATAQMAAPPQIDLKPIEGGLKELTEYLQSPAEVVRDDGGRAIGVKRGNVTKTIKRGPDGKVQGTQ